MTSKTRQQQQAASALRATTDAQVAALTAWQQDDPEGLAAAVATIGALTDARQDDPEVAAHAALIVGGYRTGAASPAMAAAAAVKRARQVVASAHALEEWAGDAGDMVEEVTGDPRRAGTLTRYAPAPDAPYAWHPGDIVASLTSRSPRLAQVATEWRQHERTVAAARQAGEVAPCGCGDHLSHRVTLQGMTAHLAGLTRDDSGYWSTYRATRAQLAGARATFAREGLAGDPAPLADAHPRTARATGGDRTPVTTSHPDEVATIGTRAAGEDTVREEVTTREVTTVRDMRPGSTVLPDMTREYRAACRAYDRAMAAARVDYFTRAGREVASVGRGHTRAAWRPLDSLGYVAALGYAPAPLADAIVAAAAEVTRAERAAMPARVTVTTSREVTTREVTRTTGEVTARDLSPVERQQTTGRVHRYGPTCAGDACDHGSCQRIRYASLARASRRPDHGGEWGSVTTAPAPASDRTDTGQVRTFAVPVSPRKRARTGSTGPTTRAW